jgi:hypothetical protein
VPERINDLLRVFAALGLSHTVELNDQDGGESPPHRS